jgi:hypothetical protein
LGPVIATAKQTLLANGDAYFEQVSQTFLLFGDPAQTLKIPLPRMPDGVKAHWEANAVRIRWNTALDANGNPVAGYNIYRASAPAGPYSKINSELVTGTEFVETQGSVGIEEAGEGSGSYYAVSSVDSFGDESAQSLGVSPASVASAAGSGGGGCFINTVSGSIPAGLFWIFAAFTIAVAITIRFTAQGTRRTVKCS